MIFRYQEVAVNHIQIFRNNRVHKKKRHVYRIPFIIEFPYLPDLSLIFTGFQNDTSNDTRTIPVYDILCCRKTVSHTVFSKFSSSSSSSSHIKFKMSQGRRVFVSSYSLCVVFLGLRVVFVETLFQPNFHSNIINFPQDLKKNRVHKKKR